MRIDIAMDQLDRRWLQQTLRDYRAAQEAREARWSREADERAKTAAANLAHDLDALGLLAALERALRRGAA